VEEEVEVGVEAGDSSESDGELDGSGAFGRGEGGGEGGGGGDGAGGGEGSGALGQAHSAGRGDFPRARANRGRTARSSPRPPLLPPIHPPPDPGARCGGRGAAARMAPAPADGQSGGGRKRHRAIGSEALSRQEEALSRQEEAPARAQGGGGAAVRPRTGGIAAAAAEEERAEEEAVEEEEVEEMEWEAEEAVPRAAQTPSRAQPMGNSQLDADWLDGPSMMGNSLRTLHRWHCATTGATTAAGASSEPAATTWHCAGAAPTSGAGRSFAADGPPASVRAHPSANQLGESTGRGKLATLREIARMCNSATCAGSKGAADT
jgi:hypothetical protein